MLAVFCAENSREIHCARCASARRKALAASVFVLLYQQLRQYFYFCTSSCVSICTFVLASASVFVLLYQQLRQYLYFCTSSCVSICTFVVYVLLCYPTCASAASIFCIHIMHTHTHTLLCYPTCASAAKSGAAGCVFRLAKAQSVLATPCAVKPAVKPVLPAGARECSHRSSARCGGKRR